MKHLVSFLEHHRQIAPRVFGALFALVVMFGIAPSVFADVQRFVEPTKVPLEIPIGSVTAATLSEYIVVLHQYLVSTAAIFAVIYMMFGGYRWIFAAGNKQHVASAQDMIWTSAVGLFLALTSYILLVTLNPQTVKFPQIPIPYLSDKELVLAGSVNKLCDMKSIIRDYNKSEIPECGTPISSKDSDGKVDTCMSTYCHEEFCGLNKNILGNYTEGHCYGVAEFEGLDGSKTLASSNYAIACGRLQVQKFINLYDYDVGALCPYDYRPNISKDGLDVFQTCTDAEEIKVDTLLTEKGQYNLTDMFTGSMSCR